MPTVLITGGTGMVGKRLTEMLLEKGYEVSILSRGSKPSSCPPERAVLVRAGIIDHSKKSINHELLTIYQWNIAQSYIDPQAISTADFIIHLAGAGVADERWTDKRKKEIADSRTQSGALLVKALTEIPNKVQAVISASAIGWYGPDKKNNANAFVETDPAYPDFLGETCILWEKSIQPVKALGKRLVNLRIGIVLSNEGGALVEFKKPMKFKTAAILGSGQQMISWIHVDDVCNEFIYAMENHYIQGVFNAVSSHPVSNKTLTQLLAKQLCGSFFIPIHVPAILLNIILGELSIEVLKSTTVSNQKIVDAGFEFTYPTIESAINALVKK